MATRQQRGEATRTTILTVARRLFSDFGYHRTGIADIQEAAGLTKGAFYHHFRTKQELALGVLEMVGEEYAECLIQPAQGESSPGRQLAAFLDSIVTLNSRPEWRNCRAVATLSAEVTAADGALADAVRSMQERRAEMLEEMIARAKESGEVVDVEPRVGAELILSALMGLLLSRKLGVNRVEPAAIVGELKRFLFRSG